MQYWDTIDDFWKFKDIMRDSGSPSPFNAPYIRGVKKHDADYVFDDKIISIMEIQEELEKRINVLKKIKYRLVVAERMLKSLE